MTFIAPAPSSRPFGAAIQSIGLFGRRTRMFGRIRIGDEDVARRAMGTDHAMPPATLPGTSLEHLARIALG